MAWLREDGIWKLRRDFFGGIGLDNVVSLTGDDVKEFASFDLVKAYLGLGDDMFRDVIEDLANLNVNFAIVLGDTGSRTSFTLRTTVNPVQTAAVPLPAAAPLLIGGLAALGMLRRRRRKTA